MTLMWLSFAMNWILKGPVILSLLDDAFRDELGTAQCFEVSALHGQDHGRIARVRARVLHVLGQRIDDELPLSAQRRLSLSRARSR